MLVLCLALVLLMAVSVPAGATAGLWSYAAIDIDDTTFGNQYFSGGSGTSGDPYQIASAQELANLSYLINNAAAGYCESTVHYKLTADITLNDWTDDGDGVAESGEFSNNSGAALQWTPIGTGEFAGTFDGKGHIVSGVYAESNNGLGLFGKIATGAAVQNSGLRNSYICSSKDAGGIALRNYGTIANCSSAATVISTGTSLSAGGISAVNQGGTVLCCYNTGAVSATGHLGNAGGICGFNYISPANINSCYNIGAVCANGNAGGIVGYNMATAVENCYWLSGGPANAVGGSTSATNCSAFGQDQNLTDPVTIGGASRTTLLAALDAHSAGTWFSSSAVNGGYPVFAGYDGGAGDTESDPYLISNAAQLAYLAYMVNSGTTYSGTYFLMTADIALNPGTFASNGTYTPAGSENAVEWTPIGTDEATYYFSGSFNGGGHTVSGIYINKTGTNLSDENQGLFGVLQGGTIQNVGIINSYIRGYRYAGGITGRNINSTIQNCYNSALVTAAQGAGGIVGIGNSGTVTKCFNIGSITGTGSTSLQMGGIVGQNALTIAYCYNAGSITGYESVGGIAGSNAYGGSVQYSFNSGSISGDPAGSAYFGSIAGRDLPTTVSSCFYDKQMCASFGIGNTADTVGVTEGKLTKDLIGTSLSTDLGSADNWTFTAGFYPRLAEMSGTDAAYVAAAPVFLYDNSGAFATDYETCASVTKDFSLGIINNVGWASANTATVSISDDDAVICGSNSGGINLTATLRSALKTVRLDSVTHFCSVIYSLNGGSGTLPTQSSLAEGSSFTIAPSSGFARTGYIFDCWSSGIGRYGADSIYNNIANNVLFTAIWKAAAPSLAPVLNAKTGTTITVSAAAGQEYSIDSGSTWQSSNIFTGLNINTSYNIVSRVAATGSDLASDESPALSVTTASPASKGTSRTITVTETSSGLFSGAQGTIRAQANMASAFSNSVEVKVTDTDENASGFGLGVANTIFPFDISLYIKGTNTKTEPKDGYAVTISLPVPDNLLDKKERLSIAHKADDGSITTIASQLKLIGGIWYLVFEATEFSPYALVVSGAGAYDQAAGLPYYADLEGNEVFIGLAANGKYIAPSGVTVLFKKNAKTFTDIGSHWAQDYIEFVTEREVFLGTKSDAFSPDSGMTRAMFATVIGRLYERSFGQIEVSAEHAFTDCEYDGYYEKYVNWAAESGIFGGYGNNLFGPGDSITREQMAAILYRFADFLNVLPDNMDTELNYPDADSISSYAKNAALYCQITGIITGRDGGNFVPQGKVTRAEVATIIQRFIESVMA